MSEDEADRLAAQSALYDEALETDVTGPCAGLPLRSQMLLRIADDEVDVVMPVVHTDAGRAVARREYDQLSEDELAEVKRVIAQHWSLNVNLAVRRLWHAAEVLGFRADSLDPKHVALLAAIYISRSPGDVLAELEQFANP